MPPVDHKQRFLFISASLILLFVFMLVQWLQTRAEAQAVTSIDGVRACYPEVQPTGRDFDTVLAEVNEVMATALGNSPDPADRALAIAAFGERDQRLEQLRSLFATDSEEPLVGLQFLNACLQDITQAGCEPTLLNEVAEASGDNAFAWQMIAKYRVLQGDDNGAVASLRAASTAADYDVHFLDQLARLQAMIPTADPLVATYARLNLLFSLQGAQLYNNHTSIIAYCSETGSLRADVAQYCAALGQKAVAQDSAMLYRLLGSALLETAHLSRGDFAAADQVRADYESFQQELGELSQAMSAAANLSTYDGELAALWVDALINEGELAARERLVAEARERSSSADYQPCQTPGLRFDFPFFYVGAERLVL